MYRSNGNYEAFARPKKPENVDQKSAYLVGSGLASLSAAAFLVRDGQMKGENIHILEELPIAGGSLDGILNPTRGFIIRGGREMENHFECLWDLFRSIPSLEVENASVLDEFYWLNKEDPNFSKCRVIENRGHQIKTDGKFTLSDKSSEEMMKLFLTSESQLQNKKITDVFSEEFFDSNFWIYWSSMFAFEKWHSAIEMRRYIMRFIHHIDGLPDLSALKFTKYNQYESLVLPLVKYLEKNGVHFQYDTTVKNILIEQRAEKKFANALIVNIDGEEKTIYLTENDLVFVTNGSITESTTYGDNDHPAPVNKALGGSWQLWKSLSEQDSSFGKPEKFYDNLPEESWFVSATLTTLDDKIAPYIEKISKRDPYAGKVVTGGIVTARDSNWMLSYTLNRQPHFKAQPKDQLVVWIYGLLSNQPGNFIKKSITECSGSEIAQEWLYHLGVPVEEIPALAQHSANTIPCYMPYITSYFMARADGDRPLVVPEGSINLAFIGNFSETERDTVFTTEYSVRTAMEAVYTLLEVDRGVPEVFASAYDIRTLLNSTSRLLDGRKLEDIKIPWLLRKLEKKGLKKIQGTLIQELLQDSDLI
ncbi:MULTISPECIES: oleate hydratase [unclassified Enterococcus]|uniref:oleate hydratase n=1 Tax=unclassified Enterococcus TaxID=2608891 RepID=UPI0015561449|nr:MULTISPECIES: oleate hydratase [unclassified Enterococcus]MBS7577130.1 oleate hydratase [Enterococcus sp. MMGLQ5-2]MBS7584423.1 oleate hydratase [Enterococcus sp. MMGLQ5-1]NPD12278.1 oleate hydratase [Enterococcus sp. MMGLQ5-1]NPD36964.1 oleate hydratase [Enterococcus sp. MMGLQ5-2]